MDQLDDPQTYVIVAIERWPSGYWWVKVQCPDRKIRGIVVPQFVLQVLNVEMATAAVATIIENART